MTTLLWSLVGLFGGILAVVLMLFLKIKSTYNLLVALDNRCDTAFADIDAHLKHRHNLIPGLVEVVKGMTDYEKSMVQGVTDAWALAMNALETEVKLKAEGDLSANINNLLASAQKYPDLRALPEFAQLRQQLIDCENRITAARRFHNLATEEYNTALRQFPANLIAAKLRMHGRAPYDLGVERVLLDEPLRIAL